MSTIFYTSPGPYFAHHFPDATPGRSVVLFDSGTEQGFSVGVPAGIDWTENPWTYYQQAYPEIVGETEQPSAPTVLAWDPPPPEEAPPVTDVEPASRALATRRQTREDVIFSDTAGLVATCYAWLQRECTVPGGGNDKKTASQALQAGQGLCSTTGYGVALRAWIDFAAPDFYQAMSAPDEARPWLEWVPAGEAKSIREAILDRVYLATYGVARK